MAPPLPATEVTRMDFRDNPVQLLNYGYSMVCNHMESTGKFLDSSEQKRLNLFVKYQSMSPSICVIILSNINPIDM